MAYEGVEYSKGDTINALTKEQIDLLAATDCGILIHCLRSRPGHFDVERIRLLLELGAVEAKRRQADLIVSRH